MGASGGRALADAGLRGERLGLSKVDEVIGGRLSDIQRLEVGDAPAELLDGSADEIVGDSLALRAPGFVEGDDAACRFESSPRWNLSDHATELRSFAPWVASCVDVIVRHGSVTDFSEPALEAEARDGGEAAAVGAAAHLDHEPFGQVERREVFAKAVVELSGEALGLRDG